MTNAIKSSILAEMLMDKLNRGFRAQAVFKLSEYNTNTTTISIIASFQVPLNFATISLIQVIIKKWIQQCGYALSYEFFNNPDFDKDSYDLDFNITICYLDNICVIHDQQNLDDYIL